VRPAGEVRQALYRASSELATADSAPTLRELAAASQVGLLAARRTVSDMCRAGVLHIARTRKVAYRNRPVAEYCPRKPAQQVEPRCALQAIVTTWASPSV